MSVKKMTCIVCPFGCSLEIKLNENGEFESVSGHTCKRGARYAEDEIKNPVRTLTSTVRIVGAESEMLPVKTSAPIPKGLLLPAMEKIKELYASAPVEIGTVIEKDFMVPGVDLLSCKKVEKI